jgi:glyoxylate/hydroxypyruvate/2-ketogluconate reductase
MSRPKVLIARQIFPAIVEKLRQHADVTTNDAAVDWSRDELIARLQGHDGIFVAATEPIDAALVAACPQLKAVCSMAVRRITESERLLRSGQWQRWSHDFLCGADVHGATLGILGMGRIGQAIARRGALGFGMKVVYHNRSRLAADIEAPLGARWVEKDALLRQADHLVIVVPYSKTSHHAIGAAELALMRPTATLTNVARGGVVDDAALAQALRDKRIAAAALDVFEGEPKVHPALLTVPNIVLTPHIASATVATRTKMAALAADNLIALLTGRPALTPVRA